MIDKTPAWADIPAHIPIKVKVPARVLRDPMGNVVEVRQHHLRDSESIRDFMRNTDGTYGVLTIELNAGAGGL